MRSRKKKKTDILCEVLEGGKKMMRPCGRGSGLAMLSLGNLLRKQKRKLASRVQIDMRWHLCVILRLVAHPAQDKTSTH